MEDEVALLSRVCPDRLVKELLALLLFCTSAPLSAMAAPWNLPQPITDKNTRIQYRYTVNGEQSRGTISGVQGRAWVDGMDFREVRTAIDIPIPKLSGALGQFGESLGGLLDAVELPPAHLALSRIRGVCAPEQVKSTGACKGTAEGTATFGQMKRPVSFPIVVSRVSRGFRIEGAGEFEPPRSNEMGPGSVFALVDRAQVSFSIELPDRP